MLQSGSPRGTKRSSPTQTWRTSHGTRPGAARRGAPGRRAPASSRRSRRGRLARVAAALRRRARSREDGSATAAAADAWRRPDDDRRLAGAARIMAPAAALGRLRARPGGPPWPASPPRPGRGRRPRSPRPAGRRPSGAAAWNVRSSASTPSCQARTWTLLGLGRHLRPQLGAAALGEQLDAQRRAAGHAGDDRPDHDLDVRPAAPLQGGAQARARDRAERRDGRMRPPPAAAGRPRGPAASRPAARAARRARRRGRSA